MRTAQWADLYAWHVDRASTTPLFRQIYLQIRSAVVSRTLAPGLRLPSTRELASRLGVARASVVSAYEQLVAEGYITGRARSGTLVSADLPAPIGRHVPAIRVRHAVGLHPHPSDFAVCYGSEVSGRGRGRPLQHGADSC